jgi:protease-4
LVITIIAGMAITGIVLSVMGDGGRGEGLKARGGRIAILEVNGPIGDDQQFLEDLHDFRKDGSIKGYIVSINSPGGVVAPSQSIYSELKRVRREDKVPVYAVIGGVGASGGYYIALGADSIYAMPGSITGSIGVIMEFPDASGLMQKVGVQMQTVKSAEHKDIGSPFRPMNEGDKVLLESLVQDVYSQFVNAVATERKLSVDSVRKFADGRILTGQQAKAAGLIDGLGNMPDVLASIGRRTKLGADPRVVRPERRREGLLGALLGKTAAGAVEAVVKPLSEISGPRLMYTTPW